VFSETKLRGDLAIAEAAGDQGEDFELACRDAEGLLVGRILSNSFARRCLGTSSIRLILASSDA
jgi:hypothetical protein